MSFTSESLQVNTALIQASNTTQGTDDAAKIFQTQIGGAMVQEYDAEIQDYTNELQAINTQKEAVRTDKNQTTVLLSQLTSADGYCDSANKAMTGSVAEITTDEKTEIQDLADSLGITLTIGSKTTDGTTTYGIAESSLKALGDALDSKLSDLNSTSELKMIQFQSLMDARKQSMMMLSNLLSSDNQTKMAVIQNMKN